MIELDQIATEQRNAATMEIDKASTQEIVRLMNREDQKVALAVEQVLDEVARAVDVIYDRLLQGGRLIYCGCGTSGRLGVLDAVECPPTFSTDYEMVQGLMAGGIPAFVKAVEGAEDNFELGGTDLAAIQFTDKDVLVGIAASGRTPYVLGAMQHARQVGAAIISVTCCPGSAIDRAADIAIAPLPGPEVVTGSTRLKSGTAQKMVLNMLSTATMIRLGKVYSNLMVDVKATNEKLLHRAIRIVCTATGCTEQAAQTALVSCDYSAKTAIVMLLCELDAEQARAALVQSKGSISLVVDSRR